MKRENKCGDIKTKNVYKEGQVGIVTTKIKTIPL